MEEGDVRLRNNTQAPTLEDKFDKAAMPKVMQVKKFGFASQTKYTHLKDQDTTDYDSAWMQVTRRQATAACDCHLRRQVLQQLTGGACSSQDIGKRKQFDSKLAGLGDIDTAGRKRSKK